jgi:multidrug efflux system membrane fusion protein
MYRWLMIALFLVGVGTAGCTNRRATPPPEPPPPAVTVARPVVRTVEQFTDLTGILAAAKTVDVRPRVSGYIKEVYVNRDPPPPGGDPSEAALAAILGHPIVLPSLRFREGGEVLAGQALFLIDPAPFAAALTKAEAERQSAGAQLALAEANYARLLKARASVSQEELVTAAAQVKVAEANVASAAAAVLQARLNLDYTTVEAPISGRIDRVYYDEGNVVTGGTSQGSVLTTIVSTDPIHAYFDVDEPTVLAYLRMIKEGKFRSMQEAEVVAEIQLKGEVGYPHRGVLEFASNRLNPGTGSLQIRGKFPNPGPPRILAPGMFVRGRIPLATRVDAVLIPDEAVTTDQARRVVYVVGPDNRVSVRPVELGPLSDGLRVVDRGLAPDEWIIIRGLLRVQPGAVVDPQPGEIRSPADGSQATPAQKP